MEDSCDEPPDLINSNNKNYRLKHYLNNQFYSQHIDMTHERLIDDESLAIQSTMTSIMGETTPKPVGLAMLIKQTKNDLIKLTVFQN